MNTIMENVVTARFLFSARNFAMKYNRQNNGTKLKIGRGNRVFVGDHSSDVIKSIEYYEDLGVDIRLNTKKSMS